MLSGNLDAFALPDVVRLLATKQVTGRIEIQREEIAGELWIDRGRIVASRLADEEAPTNVDEAIDVAVVLFDGTAGEFSVKPEDWVGGPLDLDADGLMAAVDKRRQEWAQVISSLGSLEDPLLLAPELPSGADDVTLTRDQWKLLTLIDGSRSVQDIARDSVSTVYHTALQMAELADAGLVARGSGVKWEGAQKSHGDNPIEVLRELGDAPSPAAVDEDAEALLAEAIEGADVRPLRANDKESQRERRRILRR